MARRRRQHRHRRIDAERLTDGARAFFGADYVREAIVLGYATTLHSAQAVTADATHAVLSENTTRAMLYVAMTRGRDVNIAYLYERASEREYGLTPPDGRHVLQRDTSHNAGLIAQAIIAHMRTFPSAPTKSQHAHHAHCCPT